MLSSAASETLTAASTDDSCSAAVAASSHVADHMVQDEEVTHL